MVLRCSFFICVVYIQPVSYHPVLCPFATPDHDLITPVINGVKCQIGYFFNPEAIDGDDDLDTFVANEEQPDKVWLNTSNSMGYIPAVLFLLNE